MIMRRTGFGDYETKEENEYLKKAEELGQVGDIGCLIKMHDMLGLLLSC